MVRPPPDRGPGGVLGEASGYEFLTDMGALYDYDASVEGMRRIVTALFFDPSYAEDDDYVQRRHASSTAPGAWEAIAAARFRRPGEAPPATPSAERAYDRAA